ncbi:hypothetical protein LEN26_005374 [Aphanomyces euteiches]|nr:hypothetical protein AeMF1_015065 [Aphanomyces euteiches]KAH9138254.1 hypothetical protein LEN26_005374 [Aphanomyces euteiches]KAH9182699.1 hypothetical protein AeNC1_015325 [Aphanomyces euteiches]
MLPRSISCMFLKKLFDMIETLPSELGGWCDHGTAFEIKDPREFERVVLPKYFKQCKFTSFVRQLNFYGFQKRKKETLLVAHEATESVVFFHPHFQQHAPHHMAKIKRKTNHSDTTSGGYDTPYASSTNDEVEELRADVTDIKNTLASLSAQLNQLTTIVTVVMHAAPKPASTQKF